MMTIASKIIYKPVLVINLGYYKKYVPYRMTRPTKIMKICVRVNKEKRKYYVNCVVWLLDHFRKAQEKFRKS